MSGAVSRDSLSRCEPPSMLYDVIRYPHAPPVPAKANAAVVDPAKDTIETTQQRLNREMTEKFQNTSSRLPHHSYIAVAQTGKYLFLAIMLPTYLCCYGIPKWFFYNLLPQALATVQSQIVRVGRFVSELSTHVADLMKGILEQMLGDAMRLARRQAKAFKDSFKSWRRRQAGRFAQMKKQAVAFGVSLHEAIFGFPKICGALFKKWLAGHAFGVIARIARLLAAVLRIALYPLDVADRWVLTPVGRWLKAQALFVLVQLKRLAAKMAAAMARVQKRLRGWCEPVIGLLTWVGARVQAVFVRLGGRVQRTWNAVRQWAAAGWEVISRASRRGAQRFYSAVAPFAIPVFRALQRLGASGAVRLARAGNWLTDKVKRGWERVGQAVSRLVVKMPSKRASKWLGRLRLLGKAVGGLLSVAAALFRAVMGRCLSLWAALRGMGLWLVNWLAALPAKAVRCAVYFCWLCVRAVQKGVYGLRLLLAWSVAICRLGMGQVRELSSDFGEWLLKE